MIDSLLQVDSKLLLWFNNHQSDFLDPIIWTLTGTPVWAILLLAFIAWQLSLSGSLRNAKRIAVLFLGIAMCIALSDRISSGVLKPGVARYRPSHNPELKDQLRLYEKENGKVYRGGKYGFVSSHATNSTSVAVFLFLIFGASSSSALVFIWPIVFSYTRMYLGVHYPGDILGGALLGASIALLVHFLLMRWFPNQLNKLIVV